MSRFEDSNEVIRVLKADSSEVVVEVDVRKFSSSVSTETLAVSGGEISSMNRHYLDIPYPLFGVSASDPQPP